MLIEKRPFIFIIILVYSIHSFANDTITISGSNSSQKIDESIFMLEDLMDTMNLLNIISSDKFKKNTEPVLNRGISKTYFTLQMLIINYIKHNVISEEKPLTINIYLEDGYLIAKNNIQKWKTLGTPSGLGL